MTHDENAREDFQRVESLERQVELLNKRVDELELFVRKTKSCNARTSTLLEDIRSGKGLSPITYDNDGLEPGLRKRGF